MRNSYFIYATFPKPESDPDALYLTKEGDWTFKINDDSFTLSEPQTNWQLIGQVIKVEDGDTILDDNSFYTFDKHATWVIEGLLDGTMRHLIRENDVLFARSIPREKYLNNPDAVKAEQQHITKQYGYSNLVVTNKQQQHNTWEDEAKIACRKTKR
jgi:hypothetical protein